MNTMLGKMFNDLDIYIESGCKCVLKAGRPDMAERIYNCYESVNINDSNILQRLDPNLPSYFEKCGGIFTIPSCNEIKNLMSEGKDAFIISENMDADNAVNAVLHVSIKRNEIYNSLCFSDQADYKLKKSIYDKISKNMIVYPLEYIVIQEFSGKGLVYSVLLPVYEKLIGIGLNYALTEIYTILNYRETTGKVTVLNCPNMKSIYINRNIGGVRIGHLNIKEYGFNNCTVKIRPDIYAVDLKNAVKIMTEMNIRT